MRVGRVIAVIAGLVISLFGLALLLPAVGGLLVVGFDDKLDTGTTDLDTKTAAIAAETGDLGEDSVGNRAPGSRSLANLEVDVGSDKDLFLGVGPSDEVTRYLDQAAWDEVDAFTSGWFSSSTDVDYTRQGGSSVGNLAAPTEQSFWTEQSTGRDVQLDWDVPDEGKYSVVLMNADGTADITSRGSIEIEVPYLTPVLIGMLIVGILLLLLGLFFLFKVGRGHPQTRAYQAPAPPAPAAPA